NERRASVAARCLCPDRRAARRIVHGVQFLSSRRNWPQSRHTHDSRPCSRGPGAESSLRLPWLLDPRQRQDELQGAVPAARSARSGRLVTFATVNGSCFSGLTFPSKSVL